MFEFLFFRKTLYFPLMNYQLAFVIVLLLVSIGMFIWRRFRVDFVALFALVLLSLAGIMDFKDAISGFSDPMILMIALMFVISEALARTGVSHRVGVWILKKSGNNIPRVIILMMIAVALLGSMMSTTAIIAIFLPIALNMAIRLKIAPAKILMPLAFAGIISGLMTLVATTPNMIMSSILERQTGQGLGFFSITPMGVIILAMALVYMLYAHKFLGNTKEAKADIAPRKGLADFAKDYKLNGREIVFIVKKNSQIIGKSLKDIEMRSRYNVNIVCIERKIGRKKAMLNPRPETIIQSGDILLADLSFKRHKLSFYNKAMGLEVKPISDSYFMDNSIEMGMAEISVSSESDYIGHTLADANFRDTFGLHVIGMRRNRHPLRNNLPDIRLKVGDILLVVGPWSSIRRMHSTDAGFFLLSIPLELSDTATAPDRAPHAIACMTLMVVLMACTDVPNALAALIACLLMIVFKCLSIEEAYRSINWPTLVLIVCMMPFATALEKTGGIKLATSGLFHICSGGGPHMLLGGLFFLTMLIGLFMSNTITAILMGPVAMTTAGMLNASPYPFAIAVAVAASTAYMSPLSTTVNLLVWEPGRYSFWDFIRIGVPFSLMVMIVSVIAIPFLFPF